MTLPGSGTQLNAKRDDDLLPERPPAGQFFHASAAGALESWPCNSCGTSIAGREPASELRTPHPPSPGLRSCCSLAGAASRARMCKFRKLVATVAVLASEAESRSKRSERGAERASERRERRGNDQRWWREPGEEMFPCPERPTEELKGGFKLLFLFKALEVVFLAWQVKSPCGGVSLELEQRGRRA